MKINVQVDLSEFFSGDDEASFSEQIKLDISRNVYDLVWKSLNKEMMSSFEKQVSRKIELDKELKIREKMDDLFTNQKMKKSGFNTELVSVSEYIELELNKNFSTSREIDDRVQRLIKERSNELIDELKDRYDLLFASQIVSKMKENGFLKDDVAKLLLD